MKFDVSTPHNELPSLPSKQDIETQKILKACIEARASLAKPHKNADMLPNQNALINTFTFTRG